MRRAILFLLDSLIEEKKESNRYCDVLALARDLIANYDDNYEIYADDVTADIIREYIKGYEEANGCKFE